MVWLVVIGWGLKALGAVLPLLGLVGLYRTAKKRRKWLARTGLTLDDPLVLLMSREELAMQIIIDDVENGPVKVRRDFLLIGGGVVMSVIGSLFPTWM